MNHYERSFAFIIPIPAASPVGAHIPGERVDLSFIFDDQGILQSYNVFTPWRLGCTTHCVNKFHDCVKSRGLKNKTVSTCKKERLLCYKDECFFPTHCISRFSEGRGVALVKVVCLRAAKGKDQFYFSYGNVERWSKPPGVEFIGY